MKKTIAIILAVLFCLCTVSCSGNKDVPDGMQDATREGEPFLLCVPKDWALNTDSGISGAYYSPTKKVMVTARYFTPSDAEMTVENYMDLCADGYARTMTDFSIVERGAAVLDGKNAVKLTYTVTDDGVKYTCSQTTVLNEGYFISLNTYYPSDAAETYAEAFTSITDNFKVRGLEFPDYETVTDKKTPDGMKIASSDDLEYRLYVPSVWVCNARSRKAEAYYPESGKTNVTVTSYSPDTSKTIEVYSAECLAEYEKSLSGYELVKNEDVTFGSNTGKSAVFHAEYDGVKYTLQQVFLLHNELFYTLTYTALDENYDTHIADFEQILSSFKFR